MKAFLAYRFGDEDRELVGKIETLLNSHDVKVVTGARLGGRVLTPAIKERIASADALVALMTRREPSGASGRWKTHPWVQRELAHARALKKLTIALLEGGVRIPSGLGQHERIALHRENPADALLALSETVRLWKEELGNPRRLLIKPDAVGQELLATAGLLCRYRFVSPQGIRSTWKLSDPILQPGATVLYVDGVRSDEYCIEVQVLKNRRVAWTSMATAQLISIELSPMDGARTP